MSRALIVIVLNLLGLGGLYFVLRPAPTTSGDYSASTEPSAGEVRECIYGVKIKDGAMCPAEISVEEGDQVTLWWTSHAPVEVHLHGYDLEEEVSPGEETGSLVRGESDRAIRDRRTRDGDPTRYAPGAAALEDW